MKSRATIPAIFGALAILAFVLAITRHNQRQLAAHLPPRVECAGQSQASAAAIAWAAKHGGVVWPVVGTGSMAPYIPAAAAGEDPRTTVVAYAVTMPGATFGEIAVGKLCIYRAAWAGGALVIHCAAQRDRDGWIMSGLHNPSSEAGWRVTATNFVGIVGRVFTWPPKAGR